MTELHHRATWDARIKQVETIHPQGAGWIAEALELGEQAVREKNALEACNTQRLAKQREKIRTLEELVESLAKRVLAANGALRHSQGRIVQMCTQARAGKGTSKRDATT